MISKTIEYLTDNNLYKTSEAVEIAKGSYKLGGWRKKIVRLFKNNK